MANTKPVKHPKGAPASMGGKFAPTTGQRNRGAVPSDDLQVWNEILTAVDRHSANHARRYGVDPADVADAVMIGLAVHAEASPEWISDGVDKNGYVARCCANAAYRIANRDRRQIVADAQKRLARAIDSANRSLTPDDIEKMAERVEEMMGSDLPQHWWLHASRNASIDSALAANPNSTMAGTAASAEDQALDEPGDALDHDAMIDELTATRGTGQSTWSTLASVMDAPPATPGFFRENKAIELRAELAGTPGGLETLMRGWDKLELTPEQEFLLFAPWGGQRPGAVATGPVMNRWAPPNATDQERLVDTLRRVGAERSATAWSDALRDATTYVVRGGGLGNRKTSLGRMERE